MPLSTVSAVLLLAMAVLNGARLSRWQGHQTLKEPLVVVLHLAYALIPLGALAIGVATLLDADALARGAQHIWMVGAVGLMCLAVMTRATLGHSGRPLSAGLGTTLIYASIIGATAVRFAAAVWPANAPALWSLSGALWLLAFTLFVILYAPLMIRARAG